jgi:hypothetical protein
MKYDGYRCQAAISGKTVRLYTSRGLDWTGRFGRVLPPLKGLTRGTLLIMVRSAQLTSTAGPIVRCCRTDRVLRL